MSDGSAPGAAHPEEVLPPARVMRVVKRVPKYVPAGQNYPTSEAFVPTDVEKEDARREGLAVRVSVWDDSITTSAQAVEFRRRAAPAGNEPAFAVYRIAITDIHAVRDALVEPRLRIVRDVRDCNVGPGSEGHCGVEGLDAQRGAPNAKARARAV
jgi:hypothetical protein